MGKPTQWTTHAGVWVLHDKAGPLLLLDQAGAAMTRRTSSKAREWLVKEAVKPRQGRRLQHPEPG